MTLPVLTAAPSPDDGPNLDLPVLHDLSLDGYLAFQGALDQARHLVTMHRRDAANPALPAVTRAQAAAVATDVQATIQLFAALVDDRTDLDALYLAEDTAPGADQRARLTTALATARRIVAESQADAADPDLTEDERAACATAATAQAHVVEVFADLLADPDPITTTALANAVHVAQGLITPHQDDAHHRGLPEGQRFAAGQVAFAQTCVLDVFTALLGTTTVVTDVLGVAA